MLDILDIINDATKEANSFENHAAKNLTLEERLLYLQGLALVMNSDGEIHPEEKEYIRILIKSFEMDEAILDSFVEFAQRPDKDTVQAFFRTFRRRPIAQLFLFDALMMTRRDDNIDEKEKAVVDKIAEQLEVLKGTYQDIFDLFCHIKNKDWAESALYFTSHLLDVNNFDHLLSYYSIDNEELVYRTETLSKKRLQQYIQKKMGITDVLWGDLSYSNESINASGKKISMKPFKNLKSFSYEIIVPYIQHLIDRNEAVVNNEVLYLGVDNGGEFVFNLDDVFLKYDKLNKVIHISQEVNETDIIQCPDNIIFKFLGFTKTGDALVDFAAYISSLGLSVGWIEILNDKVYFPKINENVTDSSIHPTININAYCNVLICHSDGSLSMNEQPGSEDGYFYENHPCLGYISDSRLKDIASSGYNFFKEKVVDGEGSIERDYFLYTSTYSDGVPDGFAIGIPNSQHESSGWISLKEKVKFEDIIESGCFLVK